MRVLVVDDESLARERLKKMLAVEQEVVEIVEAANGREAIQQAEQQAIDLVFMDIRMPGMDGLEAARHLMQFEKPPAIIFTTAYDEYALQAFEVNAIGYLVKPVRHQKLTQAITNLARLSFTNLAAVAEQGSARTHISANVRGNIELVPLSDIYYFKAEHKYVIVRHPGGELLIEESLKHLEQEFVEQFVRVHRNALINPAHICGLSKDQQGHLEINFKAIDDLIEVSRRHASEIRKLVKQL